ncbi:antibiotic biosynthesis monooxygenase family protein [Deinococcus enclensis]|uniref:Heme-degrading monooxygenase HmoA n=1 Tax=Deinococcus enclensis TaxID=1049582 RepID=A0ABT9MBK8_9DEIO|nr:antibiotic biosynthesis monooxygenase [Deinococcus enclensis]MDP9763972.1 heme-degrading monooxygenase HmoA [Deinococcus enclensis]
MITVMNRIPVKAEYAEAFEARFRDRARLVDGMPGFVRNEVLRPTQPGQPYIVLTYWESREAFEAWTASDAFREGHARSGSLPREAFAGRNELEVHEVLPGPAAD